MSDQSKSVDEPGLAIDELAARFGVSPRTIHFYIAQGLLPGPGARGKGASYGEEHIARLRLIRSLTERHMPLAKIEELLRGLSLDEVKRLQAAEDGISAQLEEAERQKSPQNYVQALLDNARQARGLSLQSQPASLPPRVSAPDSSKRSVTRSAPPSPPFAPETGRANERKGDYTGEANEAKAEPKGETWRRWTLAPGVELTASEQAQARYDDLLRELLRVARQHENKRSGT